MVQGELKEWGTMATQKKSSNETSAKPRSKTPTNQATARTAKAERATTKTAGGKKKAIDYRGERFEGYNKPKLTPDHPTKKAAVLAKDGDAIKLIRFGAQGYGHNYSEEARTSYLARSKKLKGVNDKLSANYWARKFLWAGKGGATRQPESASRS
jgi:hypothetical protein